jgi:hypothetical protein
MGDRAGDVTRMEEPGAMVHISKGVLATAAVAAAAAVLLAAYRLLVIVDRNRVGARAVGRRTSWPLLLARVRPGSLAASTMRESCAPSPVIAAASRAREILGTARRVLADPANRARYDETAGIRLRTRGLSVPVSFPSQPGAERPDVDFIAGIAGLEMLGGLLMLGEWMAPHPRPPSRVAVPDVQGLFTACACRSRESWVFASPRSGSPSIPCRSTASWSASLRGHQYGHAGAVC